MACGNSGIIPARLTYQILDCQIRVPKLSKINCQIPTSAITMLNQRWGEKDACNTLTKIRSGPPASQFLFRKVSDFIYFSKKKPDIQASKSLIVHARVL